MVTTTRRHLVGVAAGARAQAASMRRRVRSSRPAAISSRAAHRSPREPDQAGQPAGAGAVAAVGVEVGGLAGATGHVDHGRRRRGRAGRARPRRGRAPGCPRTWWRRRPARAPRPRRCISGGHLVAGAADVRPDPGGDRGRRRARASRRRVAGTTPAASPGRPECAAPITPASGSASRTGTQSAARTISTTSGRAVTTPSACGTPPAVGRVDDVDDRPVHLVEVGERSHPVRSRPARGRGSARSPPGRRPPSRARLSESKGTALTPPYLSVKARSTGPCVLRWEYTRPYFRKSGTSRSSSSNCT